MPFFDALPVCRKRHQSTVSSRGKRSGAEGSPVDFYTGITLEIPPLAMLGRDDRGNLSAAGLLWIQGRKPAPGFGCLQAVKPENCPLLFLKENNRIVNFDPCSGKDSFSMLVHPFPVSIDKYEVTRYPYWGMRLKTV